MGSRDGLTGLLAREHDYLKESSFHSDSLRDRFIQLYLVLAGSALSGAVALAGSDRPLLPEVLAVLTGSLALVGLMVLLMLVRLRRVAVECMQGMVLIKVAIGRDLDPAAKSRLADTLIWDDQSLPRPPGYRNSLRTVHALSAGVVMLLAGLLAGAALFFGVQAASGVPDGRALGWSAIVGLAAILAQYRLYIALLRREMVDLDTRFQERRERLESP